MDYFSRFAVTVALTSTDSKAIASAFLDEVICKHGKPRALLSDRGSNFLSSLMNELYVVWGIDKKTTTAYHPQTNGLVERFNGTLVKMLSTVCIAAEEDWFSYVQPATFAYNTSVQATIEESPYFILYGRDACLPSDAFLSNPESHFGSTERYINEMQHRYSVAWNLVKNHLVAARDAYLRNHTNVLTLPSYSPGDEVLLLLPAFVLEKGVKKSKLLHPWIGPYIIKEKRSDVTYRIFKKGQPSKEQLVNVSRLKPLLSRPGQEEIIFNTPTVQDLVSEGSALSAAGLESLGLPATADDVIIPPNRLARKRKSAIAQVIIHSRTCTAFILLFSPIFATTPTLILACLP
jgi:hypothetical protein